MDVENDEHTLRTRSRDRESESRRDACSSLVAFTLTD